MILPGPVTIFRLSAEDIVEEFGLKPVPKGYNAKKNHDITFFDPAHPKVKYSLADLMLALCKEVIELKHNTES